VIAALLEFIGSFLGFGAGEAGAAPRMARVLAWVAVIVVLLAIAWGISLLV
jgi:hypothetical protein